MLLLLIIAALVAQVEHTPIPRDVKPDFSSMQRLVGAWDCEVASSRRPRPFTQRATTSVSPDGYWLVTRTVTNKVPWNPIVIVTTDYVTYDATRNRWIDMSMDDYGAYDVSDSNGWHGNTIVWNEVAYPKLHGGVSFSPRTIMAYGNRKTVTRTWFTEASGHRVTVVTTCTKR